MTVFGGIDFAACGGERLSHFSKSRNQRLLAVSTSRARLRSFMLFPLCDGCQRCACSGYMERENWFTDPVKHMLGKPASRRVAVVRISSTFSFRDNDNLSKWIGRL